MKALSLALIAIAFAQASSAATVKANLSGDVVETQNVQQNDGHKSAMQVGFASLKELSRTETKDDVNIVLSATAGEKNNYLSVLHEATLVTLTLDLNSMSRRGESSAVAVKLQIQGDDDIFRKATGDCLVTLDQTLLCVLTPTSNPFGLLPDSELSLNLK